MVEHDEDTMFAADYIVDIGPGPGSTAGSWWPPARRRRSWPARSPITGAYLSGRRKIPVPETRRTPTGWLTIKGAAENNLKNIEVRFPLGVMTCVTGVSGSGKSSLVNEILYKTLARKLNAPGRSREIQGHRGSGAAR